MTVGEAGETFEEISAGIGDVDRQVAELAAAIEQLAAQAERLDRLVGQFSV